MESVLVSFGRGGRYGRHARGGSRYRLSTSLMTIGREVGFRYWPASLPWPRLVIPFGTNVPSMLPYLPAVPAFTAGAGPGIHMRMPRFLGHLLGGERREGRVGSTLYRVCKGAAWP